MGVMSVGVLVLPLTSYSLHLLLQGKDNSSQITVLRHPLWSLNGWENLYLDLFKLNSDSHMYP